MRLSGVRLSRLRTAAALVVAGLAALALYGYLKGLEQRTAKGGALLRVAVAAADIPAGLRIEPSSVQWLPMPENYLAGGMLQGEVEGRVARHAIAKGELLLAGDLSPGSEAGSIALRLSPGTRGYPLPLDRVSLPEGALEPGDRLDVLAVADGKCEAILEAVHLLDLLGSEGRSSGGALPGVTGGSYGFAVLELTPGEAEHLARAAAPESGEIVLVICPLEDG